VAVANKSTNKIVFPFNMVALVHFKDEEMVIAN
jgi:hypothetical protein